MDKFWMCLVEGSDGCNWCHSVQKDAYDEAERLARQPSNIGKKVFVLESVSYSVNQYCETTTDE